LREISRLLKLSRNAVRRILREREVAAVPPCPAPTPAKLDDVFARAGGNVARVQQLLAAETDLQVPYSTLTRWIREAGLRSPPRRAGEYSFAPVAAGANPHFFGGRWAKGGLGDKPSGRGRETFPCVHSGESGECGQPALSRAVRVDGYVESPFD
jgi:hypothetical protein